MATAATGWGAVCTASITAQTETTATITVTSYWQNKSWDYNINNVSSTVYCGSSSYKVLDSGKVDSTGVGFNGKVSLGSHSFTVNKTTAAQTINCYSQIVAASSYVSGTKNSEKITVTVSAKTSYTVSYNANGGSGAPSAQTKWHGTALTLSTTKPTRTGYTFAGWATSASGSVAYAAGASYTANASVTLYAKWTANTYTVSYNANGGSGAPASQTKTYGVNLTLSSTKPTRTNYNFKGWGTSASSTTVAYASGATYSANAAITLYAIWELAYVKPRITGFSVARCNSSGTVTDEGTYALIKFNWATDKTVSSIKIQWKLATASSYGSSATVSASGTSGSVSQVVGANALSTDNTYDIQAVVADSGGSTTANGTLQGTAFPIDFLDRAKGIGVAVGKPAESANLFDCAFPAQFAQNVTANDFVTKDGISLNSVKTAVDGKAPASHSHSYLPLTGGNLSGYLRADSLATGSKTGGNDGITGVFANNGGSMYLQGGANSPTLYFYSQGVTAAKAYLQVGSSGNLYVHGTGNVYLSSPNGQAQFNADRFRTNANDKFYLGDSSYKWKAVYAVNGTIQTSDRNQKENIVSIAEKYEELFKRLKPVTFELKGGEHDRTHIGLIAQDVKESMDEIGLTAQDLAAYCVDIKKEYDEEKEEDVVVLDENGKPIETYSLRYTEFIALNTHMIQKQQAEIEALKAEISELKELIKGTLS